MHIQGWDNPVITKEFRGRMRGVRAYWLLFGYVLLLSLTLFFAYLQWWNVHAASAQYGGTMAGFTIGRTFFLTLFYVQAVLVTLITPALTAGAITMEREQRTFEMLRATTLSPRAIALGKLAASVSFVVLLLTSSLPLVSLCFLLGGVSPGEVFFSYILLVADAFLFGAIGLAWSAHAANTAAATALAYGSIFAWFLLTLPSAVPAISGMNNVPYGLGMAAINPIGAVAGAVMMERYYGITLAGWIPALLVIGVFGAVLVLACINRLEDDSVSRAGPLRLTILLFCGLILFFANGVIFSFSNLGIPAFVELKLLLSLALILVSIFVPPLVTGEPRRGSARPLLASLPSGLPFALLLTLLVAVMMFWAVSLGAHALSFARHPFTNPLPLSLAWTRLSLGTAAPILIRAVILLISVSVGLGGVGLLLSVLLRNRWGALIAVYLLLILACALPYFSYALLDGQDAQAAWRNPAINTLYLSPWMGLAQLSGSVSPGSSVTFGNFGASFEGNYPVVRGMAGYGLIPFWKISAILYLLLGGLCYAAGWRLLKPLPATETSIRSV